MDWRANAACLDADPEQFFPLTDAGPSLRQVDSALAVCAGCSVRTACLNWAIANDVRHGVWGGLTEQDRYSLSAAHRLATAS
ncbi:MAG TPA: WhiB family transcriptional regulator [Mycobacteriales bacterium]|nr:WhiB family transcriptional regulator [Mycobacteriales bacterium]